MGALRWTPALAGALGGLLLAAGAVLVLLDAPASLTDEDDAMPQFLASYLAGRNPYATIHAGHVVTGGPWGGLAFGWESPYVYLPLLPFLQLPFVDYRWTALVAYGALLAALRDRPIAFLAFGNPLVLRLAASGFNDFVVLALLAWSIRSGSRALAWVAVGAKQFALPIVLVDAALRRRWRDASAALGAFAVVLLPFAVLDSASLWQNAFWGHIGKTPNLLAHWNYLLYPLFFLVVVLPESAPRAPPRPASPPLPAPRVAVVLPALDEEGAVAEVVRGFAATGARVVVVDNGSTDATARTAAEAGATVVTEPARGYGAAVLAGLAHLRAEPPDVVAVADCDGTLDPADLAALVAPIAAGRADLALGRRARHEPGALPAHARLGNASVLGFVQLLHGIEVADVPPFRAARWTLLAGLPFRERTFGHPLETLLLAARAGGRIVEVDVAYRRRAAGRSKVAGTVGGTVRAAFAFLRVAAATRFRRLAA